MSEVQSGVSKNGYQWRRMTVALEVQGYNGTFFKQVFQASGDIIDVLTDYHVGDKVQLYWTMYAREWNDRWYNNVEVMRIQPVTVPEPVADVPAAPASDDDELVF